MTSREYYEIINKYMNYYKNNKIILKSCELLLEIIDNKNDDEFNKFYLQYMGDFKSIKDLHIFIKKSYYDINDDNYYNDLIIFLTDIIKKEKLEILKKDIKKQIIKEIIDYHNLKN